VPWDELIVITEAKQAQGFHWTYAAGTGKHDLTHLETMNLAAVAIQSQVDFYNNS